MLRHSTNVFPFTLILILICLVMSDTTLGVLSKTEKPVQRSALLKEKIIKQQQVKEVCGKDKNCLLLGPGYKLNREHAIGLVTLLAELDRHR